MQPTPAWTEMRYHASQNEVWRSSYRFKALACGRGSGKTECARRYIVRMLPVRKPWADPLYFYAMPTYNQAKRVAWDKILDLIPKDWIDSINVNSLYIRTKFGSTLYVAGMDNPARIEGSQYDGGIIDESSDIKPGVFDRSIMPALAHRNGFCWRIGVPKRFGIGAAEFKEFFDLGQTENEQGVKSWAWPSTDIMSAEEISIARKVLNEADFREQYEASWESVGGLIFHGFDSAVNVRNDVKYDPDQTILVGSDFNVNPMCWCLGHKAQGKLYFFDELFVRNTNTPAILDILKSRYPNHSAGWEFFGDATGRNRNTKTVSTDYSLIRNDKRFSPKKIRYPLKNPALLNRFAASNNLLMNADKEARCFISPKCEKLIKDLNVRAYKEGTRDADDAFDIGHMSDAFGYIVYTLFPYRGSMFSSDTPRSKVIVGS